MGGGAPSIDRDVPCAHCGYNLRGLSAGRNCPECGRAIPFDFETAADPLLAGSFERRSMTKWGLTLLFASALAFAILRVACAATWSIAYWPPLAAYAGACVLIALAWSVGTIVATPHSMDLGRPVWSVRWITRWVARCTQALWLPAAVFGLLATLAGPLSLPRQSMIDLSLSFSVAAGMGWPLFAFLLHEVALEIDLDDAPRRIGIAIWTLPILTIVLMFLPLRMFFFVLALTAPLVLAWGWYLVGFSRGLWEMRQYVAWGVRSGLESVDRESRIAHKRAELEQAANAMVRPLPVPPHAPPTTPGPTPARRWR